MVMLHILNIGFEYDYADIYTVLLKDVFLASGTTGNQLPLLCFSIALAISLTGMLYDSSEKTIFYGISSNVLFFLNQNKHSYKPNQIILVLVFSLIIAIIKLIKRMAALLLSRFSQIHYTYCCFALSIVFNLFHHKSIIPLVFSMMNQLKTATTYMTEQ